MILEYLLGLVSLLLSYYCDLFSLGFGVLHPYELVLVFTLFCQVNIKSLSFILHISRILVPSILPIFSSKTDNWNTILSYGVSSQFIIHYYKYHAVIASV